MRMMIDGLTGWARMGKTRSAEVQMLDMAITVVGTLLVAVTIALLHH